MKGIIKDSLILFTITIIAGFLLGFVYDVTKEPIAKQQQITKDNACRAVFAEADSFDEYEIFADGPAAISFDGGEIDEILTAKSSDGAVLGYILTVTEHEGYGGDITFMIGIQNDGTVNGISFTSISETAGLGMKAKNPEFKDQFNGKKVESFDDVLLETKFGEDLDSYTFKVRRGEKELDIEVTPIYKEVNGEKTKEFGFSSSNKKEKGFVSALKYGVVGTYKNTVSAFNILGKLVTGKIGADNLSGPVGVYTVIDNIKENGLESIIYLIAYLSINVAVINLIPIPVFDGGRILLLLIEKVKGKKLNPKIETTINNIGAILLIILMLYVTCNDILKLF